VVVVRASTRRRRTSSAKWEGDHLVISVPAWLNDDERERVVDNLMDRAFRQKPFLQSHDFELQHRAELLADRYMNGVRPASVAWTARQQKRWGSCTNLDRTIRVSERLRHVPQWVLDAVLVHELAHLVEPNHSPRFHALANRFPRMAEADTFLAGFEIGLGVATCYSQPLPWEQSPQKE
jgi:predicted metal-dependent hydrolase